MRNLLFFLVSLCLSQVALAVDVVKIVDSQCRETDGVLVSVSETQATVLGLNGKSSTVSIANIETIAQYNIYENPLSVIQVDAKLKSLLKDYTPKDEKTIRGWAVRYVQDLVFIYDINGFSHVLDLYDIQKIRDPNPAEVPSTLRLKSERVHLATEDLGEKCKLKKKRGGKEIIATRIMSDKVQISDYLSSYEKGLRKLSSYEERTYLYPKPFLYERETSMGILATNSDRQNNIVLIPLHFKWSNGRPYRFQSQTVLGGSYMKDSATLDPLNIIESNVKSHAFHATFIGNLSALPAGTEFYSFQERLRDEAGIDSEGDIRVANAFNYTALMGGDYKRFSFSAGFYYPTYEIKAEGEFREVLGSELSPVFRFRYFADNWTFRVLGSFTDMSESKTVNNKQISIGSDSSVDGVLNDYAFQAQWVRAGLDFKITDELEASVDGVILNGSYKETTALSEENSVDFQDANSQIWLSQRFGDYVRIRGYYIMYNLFRTYDFASIEGDETRSYGELGGVFELIF